MLMAKIAVRAKAVDLRLKENKPQPAGWCFLRKTVYDRTILVDKAISTSKKETSLRSVACYSDTFFFFLGNIRAADYYRNA